MKDKKNIQLLPKEQFDLQGRDHMYRTIIENMSEGALVLSPKGTVVYSNKRFAEISSLPLQRIIGSNLKTILSDEDSEKLLATLSDAKNKRSFCEIKIHSGDLQKIPVLVSITSFILNNEQYYSCIISDITAQKQIEEGLETKVQHRARELFEANKRLNKINSELKEINAYLENFVHAIAHDLRTPVANLKLIQNMYQIAPDNQKSKLFPKVSDNIGVLDKTLKGLVQIIEAQGSKEISKPGLDAAELIHEVIQEKKFQIEQTNAHVTLACNTGTIINFVEGYLRCITRNMISNALKYAQPGHRPVLEIILDRNDEYFLLIFRDNGIGMDLAKNGHKLFKPFQRFSNHSNGMGIGLHLINNMVRKNGGFITVESKPNNGTTFTAHLKEYENQ